MSDSGSLSLGAFNCAIASRSVGEIKIKTTRTLQTTRDRFTGVVVMRVRGSGNPEQANIRVRVQLIRHFKTCTADIYLHNECAHVGLSIHAPVRVNSKDARIVIL